MTLTDVTMSKKKSGLDIKSGVGRSEIKWEISVCLVHRKGKWYFTQLRFQC